MKPRTTLLLKVFVGLTVYAALFFSLAGTASWLQGWLFLLILGVLGFALGTSTPVALWKERGRISHEGQPGWDYVLHLAIRIFGTFWLFVMPLDAVRFGWSQRFVGALPPLLQGIGALLFLLGCYGFYLVFAQNPFLSAIVRKQDDRGHHLVDTGIYGVVRHPMYAAFFPIAIGAPLLLGSWIGVLLGMVMSVVLVVRTKEEDRFLAEQLEGYAAYRQRVPHRLIPGLW